MKRSKPQRDEDHIAAGASDGDAKKQDHDAAPFAGSALGIIAGEVAGGLVGGPLGVLVGGVIGAVAGGVAGEEATRIAEPPKSRKRIRPSHPKSDAAPWSDDGAPPTPQQPRQELVTRRES